MSEPETTTTLANPVLEALKRLCDTTRHCDGRPLSMYFDHAREVIAKADEDATKSAFLVIQEGGSSMEMYAHGHDTLEDADADRFSCRDNGSYRTSEVIEVPETLASHPDFWEIAEQIARAALEVDYPEGENPLRHRGGRRRGPRLNILLVHPFCVWASCLDRT